ncbi:hypothetical protein POM88_012060 [Heracleum sosnowskyi]|uniref:Uncharacterized protein n=1 Tax=Heracleum sosnowskyi TaxID=360622 RepID=A0AAD8N1D4_9APIA|nr:hypothetical protein POM88_012060 [Heracleum sosnowskyi]
MHRKKNAVLIATSLLVPARTIYPYQLLRDKDTCEPYSTIQELKHTRLWIYQKFRCKAIILDILIRGGRHDGSCIRCKDCVCAEGSNYYCAKCGRNYITPVSRWCGDRSQGPGGNKGILAVKGNRRNCDAQANIVGGQGGQQAQITIRRCEDDISALTRISTN